MRRRPIGGSAVRRRGATLVLFALLAFGLFAIAALAIDLGFARLTQAQMQGAVDSAALEGMRWRNTLPNGTPDFNEPIPFLTENNRRILAVERVRLVFDDDMDLATEDAGAFGTGAGKFTVGPTLALEGGVGEILAHAKLARDTSRALDDPILATNEQGGLGSYNSTAGDMVSGEYDFAAVHGEDRFYERPDFTPHSFVTPAADGGAFLVRMRRTHDPDGLDERAGTSTRLPGVPLLFGLGSTVLGDTTARWDPRRDGITVRATAIATARPASSVGRAVPGRALGVVPFALALDLWNALPVTINDPECVRILPNGAIQWDLTTIGTFCAEALAVGDPVVPRPAGSFVLPLEGWVPIYERIAGLDRVIGFGFVDLETPVGCPPGQFSLSKRRSAVALHNASATVVRGDGVADPALANLLLARRELIDEPLLAPALSR